MTPDYVAPVRPVLIAHIRDRTACGLDEAPGQSATCGKTACGLDMVLADLWQIIDLEPSDKVCPRCLSLEAAGEPEVPDAGPS